MAIRSTVLARGILWTEEPWGQRVDVAEVIKQQQVGAESDRNTLHRKQTGSPTSEHGGGISSDDLAPSPALSFLSVSLRMLFILQLRRLAPALPGTGEVLWPAGPEVSTSPHPRHPPDSVPQTFQGTTCHQSQCFYIHLCLQQEISQASILGSPLVSLTQSPRSPYVPSPA